MKLLTISLVVILSSLLMACGGTPNTVEPGALTVNVKNLRQVEKNVYSSGQPTKEQLEMLKELGIKHIVNLRPAAEMDWNESELVGQLGMTYHSIPVAGGRDITHKNATLLQETLVNIGDQPVLVHCSSGNRIGSLIAVDQYMSQQKSIDAAIDEGKRWGLTRNENPVRAILDKMERPK